MPNERINISLDGEIAMQMREAALKKYGNSRSLSRFIEEMFEKDQKELPDIEKIKAQRKKFYGTTMGDDETLLPFLCQTCKALFYTAPVDGNYCPSCCSSDLDLEMISMGSGSDPLVAWWPHAKDAVKELSAKGFKASTIAKKTGYTRSVVDTLIKEMDQEKA